MTKLSKKLNFHVFIIELEKYFVYFEYKLNLCYNYDKFQKLTAKKFLNLGTL